jgi:hypothetical protein
MIEPKSMADFVDNGLEPPLAGYRIDQVRSARVVDGIGPHRAGTSPATREIRMRVADIGRRVLECDLGIRRGFRKSTAATSSQNDIASRAAAF